MAEASLAAGATVPKPIGDPVLHVAGSRAVNSGDELVLDLPTLEQLGLVRYSVSGPWLERDVTYTGVLVSDLVRLAGPPEQATKMRLVALDDYSVEIALADFERRPVLLATELDGERMEIENGGPTRIIFPYGLVDDIDELKYKDLWIWSIKSIAFD